MSDPGAVASASPDLVLRALRRTRQIRQFTDEPVMESDLSAILNVARWTGSSMNLQPWMFIVIRDRADRERLAELAPYARHVAGAGAPATLGAWHRSAAACGASAGALKRPSGGQR